LQHKVLFQMYHLYQDTHKMILMKSKKKKNEKGEIYINLHWQEKEGKKILDLFYRNMHIAQLMLFFLIYH